MQILHPLYSKEYNLKFSLESSRSVSDKSSLVFSLSSIAEKERNPIRKRQREGIDAAKNAGVRFDAPDKGYPEKWEVYYAQYKKGELTRKYVMEQLGMEAERFTYLKKKYEKEKKGE